MQIKLEWCFTNEGLGGITRIQIMRIQIADNDVEISHERDFRKLRKLKKRIFTNAQIIHSKCAVKIFNIFYTNMNQIQ